MDSSEVVNSCEAKAQRLGLNRLDNTERIIVLVSIANFEFESGGLDSFYYNSSGDEAVATVDALQAVGATIAASTLHNANALFPGGSPPRDRVKRFESLAVIRAMINRPLEKLEKEIGMDQPDVFSLLCNFIENNAANLLEHINTR